jgi:hypothetical protein
MVHIITFPAHFKMELSTALTVCRISGIIIDLYRIYTAPESFRGLSVKQTRAARNIRYALFPLIKKPRYHGKTPAMAGRKARRLTIPHIISKIQSFFNT